MGPVLVVEPTKLYQGILVSLIERHLDKVDCVENAEAAIEACKTTAYPLVFVSATLPDSNGVALAQLLKNSPSSASMVINLITANDNTSFYNDAMHKGISEVFHKGMLEEIEEYLLQYSNRQSSQEPQGKILLVEDDSSMATWISTILSEKGLEVDFCDSAESAFKCFNQGNYDLIISDYLLAGRNNALSLIRKIRIQDSSTPILVTSGVTDQSTKVELLNAGASDFISKPLLIDEFTARTFNLVRLKKLLDKTEKQRLELQKIAMHDKLTGVYNRHALSEMAPKYISEACRHQIPLSLVVIDLDHFKSINDKYGHRTGDEVLEEVGKLLSQSCRHEDLIARIGGEEFVMLLAHCDKEMAYAKAERLREAFVALKPAGIEISASLGLASISKDYTTGCDYDELFSFADQAVYHAKHNGRNRVEIYQG